MWITFLRHIIRNGCIHIRTRDHIDFKIKWTSFCKSANIWIRFTDRKAIRCVIFISICTNHWNINLPIRQIDADCLIKDYVIEFSKFFKYADRNTILPELYSVTVMTLWKAISPSSACSTMVPHWSKPVSICSTPLSEVELYWVENVFVQNGLF